MIKVPIKKEWIDNSDVKSLSIGRYIVENQNWKPAHVVSKKYVPLSNFLVLVEKRANVESDYIEMEHIVKYSNRFELQPFADDEGGENKKSLKEVKYGDFLIPQIASWDGKIIVNASELVGKGTSSDILEYRFIGDNREILFWIWDILIKHEYSDILKNLKTGKTHPRIKHFDFVKIQIPVPTEEDLKACKIKLAKFWGKISEIDKQKEDLISTIIGKK